MYAGVFGNLEKIQWYINICESIFLFDFILTFFVEYIPEESQLECAVRSFEKIFFNYLYGNMIFDLLPLIPFPMLELPMQQ
jgi:hypothetical protein